MRRVIKIGGSLLCRPDLKDLLQKWFAEQPVAENLVIVGGGELINAVRHLDQVHGLDPTETHWLCVHLLDATFHVMGELAPTWNQINNRDRLSRAIDLGFSNSVPTLVSIASFYHRDSDVDLPIGWRTTSDAIAAYLGTLVGADEVVLLKSCEVDPAMTRAQMIHRGVVDEAMTALAANVGSLRVESLIPKDRAGTPMT